jgi:hypothetical protein
MKKLMKCMKIEGIPTDYIESLFVRFVVQRSCECLLMRPIMTLPSCSVSA